MKLQFDPNQQFQLDAVNAIVDLFDGQPRGEPDYSIIKGAEVHGQLTAEEITELGVGNRFLLPQDKLLGNVREVQDRNEIENDETDETIEAWKLLDGQTDKARMCPHFSVEMETGTGKTYVYLRTIFELSQRYGFQKFIIVVPSVAIREGVLKNIEVT